jgi:NAD(P)-dependent dehydrogenase (short-subunit alcohol dehydrogenase family)
VGTGRLQGKVALVTGAGHGMGEAITRLFADEGATVLAADHKAELLLKWEGVANVVPMCADVTVLEDVDRMVETAEVDLGGLDIVCNVAGINDLCHPLEDTSDELWDKIFDVDLKAPFRISRRAAKGMVARGSGVILNIGSYAGLRGNHGPSYTAAKAGLVGLTRSLAVALTGRGVRVNIINPGGIATGIGMHDGGTYHPEGMTMLRSVIGGFPIKQMGEAEDIAQAALFLCSDAAKHINGASLSVDDGMSAC